MQAQNLLRKMTESPNADSASTSGSPRRQDRERQHRLLTSKQKSCDDLLLTTAALEVSPCSDAGRINLGVRFLRAWENADISADINCELEGMMSSCAEVF